jgi:hypothetical protein
MRLFPDFKDAYHSVPSDALRWCMGIPLWDVALVKIFFKMGYLSCCNFILRPTHTVVEVQYMKSMAFAFS